MKLFTFSRLNIPRVKMRNGRLSAGDGRPWLLQIGSPMESDFVQNFVLGLFQEQQLEIGYRGVIGRFLIAAVEALPEPHFAIEMSGKTLSPFVVSTMRENNGKLQAYYYRPTDPEIGEAIRNNLLMKYEIIYGRACEKDVFAIEFNMEYYERRKGRVSKLLHIKEGSADETKVKVFEMPFRVRGNPELIRVAWECGLGDKNSMGLGMIDVW
jgi:CRISPR-associated endoribonuclease Cas6